MSLHSEIHEQPACLERLLHRQRNVTEQIAGAIHAKAIHFVIVAARGTSENASRYANYLWGARNRLPVALAAPSLFTYYDRPPRLQGALVVGISQSGMSPDIVSVLEEGKQQGALTLAITNAVDSPLAGAADFVLNIEAGEENAVAATKTYSAELMAIAMLSASISREESVWQELMRVPEWVHRVFAGEEDIDHEAQRYHSISNCVVLGRGFNYATACEWALKLSELTYVLAQPYSSANFVHGPIAMVDGRFPVLAVIPGGDVYDSMIDVLRKLRQERSAELVVISDRNDAMELANSSLPLPFCVPEWLSPLVSILPAQLFCYYLALAKGCDTESPRGIQKVTETK